MGIGQRAAAEFFGTFWLVLGGCGAAVISRNIPALGIGLQGVALAFGLSVVTMAYAVGHISGAHFNPAVTVGLVAGRRFPASDVVPYVAAQLGGALAAATVLYLIVMIGKGAPGFVEGFATNGYGEHSPSGYPLGSVFLCEVVMTFMFLMVILGSTDKGAPPGFAPLAMGLALTLIHLISIPVDNTSVNPARSTSQALFVGGWALGQLWVFWVAPLLGGALAGFVHRSLFGART